MLFLSRLLRKRLPCGHTIVDFSFDPLDADDHPAVQQVLLSDGHIYPWVGFQDTPEGPPVPVSDGLALLERDVLDGLVLDLSTRSAVRANDLVLCEEDNQLRVVSVDLSARALLRRTTRGWLCATGKSSQMLDWKYVEFLRGDPQAAQRGVRYRGRVTRMSAGDIGALAESIPYLHAAELLTIISDGLASCVFEGLPPTLQTQIFGELPERLSHSIVAQMSPDLAADFLARLGLQRTEEVMRHIPPEPRNRLLDLLQFSATVAAGRMTNHILSLPSDCKLSEARRHYTEHQPRFNQFLYLVSQDNQLQGTLSVSELFTTADADVTLESLATPYVNALRADQPVRQAAYEVLRSQMPALPVVGSGGTLLGVFTLDAALDVILPHSISSQVPRTFI